jgi:hypothetical protein
MFKQKTINSIKLQIKLTVALFGLIPYGDTVDSAIPDLQISEIQKLWPSDPQFSKMGDSSCLLIERPDGVHAFIPREEVCLRPDFEKTKLVVITKYVSGAYLGDLVNYETNQSYGKFMFLEMIGRKLPADFNSNQPAFYTVDPNTGNYIRRMDNNCYHTELEFSKDQKYVKDSLLIGALDLQYNHPEDSPYNTPDKKVHTRLEVSNGKLTKVSGNSTQIFTTQTQNSSEIWIWVMDKKGKLYADTQADPNPTGSVIANQHSFFKKTKEKIGKPIACGGHFEVNEEGQIVKVDNRSGHYKPTPDQLVLALLEMDKRQILSPKIEIGFLDFLSISLLELRAFDSQKILQKYQYNI